MLVQSFYLSAYDHVLGTEIDPQIPYSQSRVLPNTPAGIHQLVLTSYSLFGLHTQSDSGQYLKEYNLRERIELYAEPS